MIRTRRIPVLKLSLLAVVLTACSDDQPTEPTEPDVLVGSVDLAPKSSLWIAGHWVPNQVSYVISDTEILVEDCVRFPVLNGFPSRERLDEIFREIESLGEATPRNGLLIILTSRLLLSAFGGDSRTGAEQQLAYLLDGGDPELMPPGPMLLESSTMQEFIRERDRQCFVWPRASD